jgi:hypothetical protein
MEVCILDNDPVDSKTLSRIKEYGFTVSREYSNITPLEFLVSSSRETLIKYRAKKTVFLYGDSIDKKYSFPEAGFGVSNLEEFAELLSGTPQMDCYLEKGHMHHTERYLRDRGFCCDSHCKHCPYSQGDIVGLEDLDLENFDPTKVDLRSKSFVQKLKSIFA